MIRPITFEEQVVGSKTDGGLYRNIYPHDGILWGCDMTTTNTQIEIASGMFIIGGRMIWIDGKTVLEVQDPIEEGYARLTIKIDLNESSTQEECKQLATKIDFAATEIFTKLTQEDINNTGKVYEQEFAVVKIEASNITGITRKLGNVGVDAQRLGGQTLDQLFGLIYPIGSIYMSVSNANPGTLFGGTWVSWGAGRVPVGVDNGQTEFNTVEKKDGTKAVTLTPPQMPIHQHTYPVNAQGSGVYGPNGTTGQTGGTKTTTDLAGGSQPHNNLQPYITCYMWKRTA